MDGQDMMKIASRIFPICRSITGNGVRETLKILQEYCSELKIYEVPCGTQVFDWTIPDEWNITEGYIENEAGERIIDFAENNLHVVGYSLPMDKWVDLEELKKCVHTLPEQPELIPYVTSYYTPRSGFCMTQTMLDALPEGRYHAVIRSTMDPQGSLTYGEVLIPGTEEPEKEIFFSSYVCHPSMANNECSGPSVLIALADYIRNMPSRRYSYRLILVPETIGAITYLSRNLPQMKERVIAGFNLTCVGDDMQYTIVHSRYADTLADKVLTNVLKYRGRGYKECSYLERGSDERQYCFPGVDIPLCTFSRTKFYDYPEYHTSGDNLELISPDGLQGAYEVMTECIGILECNRHYRINCLCEPQLGRRGLYPAVSKKGIYDEVRKLQDFILYADGRNDLIDISNIIEYPAGKLIDMVKVLTEQEMLSYR
ncbi:MAG: DUF4910 domain-containing protein [Lachnospiraceae bacterium]|nr:DUF4910 domain-containing protein [Lachnospiraceae bacterium]